MGAPKTSVRLRLIILVIVVLTVGGILASIVAQSLSEPYIAKEICKQGVVTTEFHSGSKGGYYLYFCKDPITGEIKNISGDVGRWSLLGLVLADVLIVLVCVGVTAIVLRVFRNENNLGEE